MTTAIYIYTSLVSLITYKGSHSVAGTLDLSLVDLASVFDEVIMTLPSHSGLYHSHCGRHESHCTLPTFVRLQEYACFVSFVEKV